MSAKVVQINFKYNVPTAAYEQAVLPAAAPIAEVPGMRWKTWIVNDARREAGGIYLFDDDASVQAYLAGPIVAGVKSHPALSDVSIKVFDVMPAHSEITRAPIASAVPV
jgi:hypothetical protein